MHSHSWDSTFKATSSFTDTKTNPSPALPCSSQLAERFLQRTRDCTLRDGVQAKVFHRDGIRLCPSPRLARSAVNFTRASTCLSVGVLEQKFEGRPRDTLRRCTMLYIFHSLEFFLASSVREISMFGFSILRCKVRYK